MAVVHYHEGGFPPEGRLDWPRLVPLLGPAAAAVARYDGMLSAIPNATVLLAPLATREAVLSSRIEGTQATLGDVLGFEAGQAPGSPERLEDVKEVLNYRRAMRHAEELLVDLPLSQRAVRAAHSVLLDGARGRGKSPGEYRRVANWIGPPGCSIEEARFVPIGADRLPDAMGAWERYIHADVPDRLVQLAVLHAEFEALHPFLDGNGRLGRMLVPLFLWRTGLIQAPTFYISAWFEARREAYYDGLLAVSRDDDWTGWCVFFLEAVRAQAEENLAKTRAILDLYEEMKVRVPEVTRSRRSIAVLDWMFSNPVFKSTDFSAGLEMTHPYAWRILNLLGQEGILLAIDRGSGRRAAVHGFPALLEIAEGEGELVLYEWDTSS